MMVSDPWNPDRNPSFVEMVCREFSKLVQQGKISPSKYNRAVDRARGQEKVLIAIYSKVANGIQRAVRFILDQVPN